MRSSVEDYLENERLKEPLGDFTLSEYNEKGKGIGGFIMTSLFTFLLITHRSCSLVYQLDSKLKELVNLWSLCKSQLFAISNKENSSN